jgi:signal transduction histidine kinase
MQIIMRILRQFRALRISLSSKFVIGVAVVLTIAMGVSIYFIDKNHEMLVMEQLDQQAKALFKQIVLTRQWIADHGGIFVEKLPWMEPSPYLNEPELLDIAGKKYLKESPAMVTKELSRYAREKGLFWFNITSLKLMNPDNAPDEFEEYALKEFELDRAKEISHVERIGSSSYYRYIAPLFIEEACLKCHSHQAYEVGDVRGAISVSVSMDSALDMMSTGRKGMVIASIATISVLMLILFVMMKELVLRPVNNLKESMREFSKGERANISIIKTGDELEELSRSFVEMSATLTEYHESLEDEVHKATKGFEEANKRLQELNEKKSDFIAQISHELRTPMTSIKGAMDYLTAKIPQISQHGEDTQHIMEFLNVIKKNADRLIRMVNDTLDIERIESGMFDLHFSEMDMLTLLKEVVISFQSISSERDITFKIACGPKIIVNVDPDRIRQVLINLISNAINYSPDNSEIQISVAPDEDTVTITVKDDGPGIPLDVQKKIFDKFYTIGKRHGTGLGLAICKGIVEAHNGEISVVQGLDKGSAICFTLPYTTVKC